MGKNENLLRYTDESDRCYGVAGMTLSLIVFDAVSYIDHIDCKNECDVDVIRFTPEVNVVTHPTLSTKAVWHALASRYRLSAAMVIGNVISRAVCLKSINIDPNMLNAIVETLDEEADARASLTHDENRELCLQTYDHLRRTFSHPVVKQVVDVLAQSISKNKTLERAEIINILSPLL